MSVVVLAARLAADRGQGGHAWAMLNWALGLERCGHRVVLVEPSRDDLTPPAASAVAWAGGVLRRHGFTGSYTIVGPGAAWSTGDLDVATLRSALGRADTLVNLSGIWRDDLSTTIPRRIYVDLDPGFTQLWELEGIDMGLDRHTAFVTVGLDLGTSRCRVPCDGRSWVTTPPPVVLDHWPATASPPGGRYTTVANWRSYGTVHRDGVRHGQKAHSFRSLLSLAACAPAPVEAALSIHPDETTDLCALDDAAWPWVPAARVAGSPERYRDYVRASRGELGIAKEGYVVARTGWVSDRSACFLASGRPVLAQDTGGSSVLADHDGFVRFRTVEEAVAGLSEFERRWDDHARGAREVARRHFAHEPVLTTVLEAAA